MDFFFECSMAAAFCLASLLLTLRLLRGGLAHKGAARLFFASSLVGFLIGAAERLSAIRELKMAVLLLIGAALSAAGLAVSLIRGSEEDSDHEP